MELRRKDLPGLMKTTNKEFIILILYQPLFRKGSIMLDYIITMSWCISRNLRGNTETHSKFRNKITLEI